MAHNDETHTGRSERSASSVKERTSEVVFAHDPVPSLPSFVEVKDVPIPGYVITLHPVSENAILLDPPQANLPYRSSLRASYESRFWKNGLNASKEILQLLARDGSNTDAVVGKGVKMAKLAQRELRPEFEHRFCKATSYMYPFASERRTKLLAASMVMMFLFDDKGEETLESDLTSFREDFVHRVTNFDRCDYPENPLQQHIDSVMSGFRDADMYEGTGGKDVIQAMSKSFRKMRPKTHFLTLRQYLNFRHDNVGADYVLAAVKFSVCSNVNLLDEKFAKVLALIKDHLAIVNDLASYDKEKRDFDSGASKDLINIVETLRVIMSLDDIDSAKTMAYVYQLQTELSVTSELRHMNNENLLSEEERIYLEALLACAAGNTFFSMTSSRYGGEKSRLHAAAKRCLPNENTEHGVLHRKRCRHK